MSAFYLTEFRNRASGVVVGDNGGDDSSGGDSENAVAALTFKHALVMSWRQIGSKKYAALCEMQIAL